jgi:hypothetical protein
MSHGLFAKFILKIFSAVGTSIYYNLVTVIRNHNVEHDYPIVKKPIRGQSYDYCFRRFSSIFRRKIDRFSYKNNVVILFSP